MQKKTLVTSAVGPEGIANNRQSILLVSYPRRWTAVARPDGVRGSAGHSKVK